MLCFTGLYAFCRVWSLLLKKKNMKVGHLTERDRETETEIVPILTMMIWNQLTFYMQRFTSKSSVILLCGGFIVVAKLCSLGLAGYAPSAVQTISSWDGETMTQMARPVWQMELCLCCFVFGRWELMHYWKGTVVHFKALNKIISSFYVWLMRRCLSLYRPLVNF